MGILKTGKIQSHGGVAGLAGRQIFVPYNGKIADIIDADTEKHFLDLAASLSETRKIIAVHLAVIRISGTEGLLLFPNEGQLSACYMYWYADSNIIIIKDGTQRVQYAKGIAIDDFDLYCLGYVVESV